MSKAVRENIGFVTELGIYILMAVFILLQM